MCTQGLGTGPHLGMVWRVQRLQDEQGRWPAPKLEEKAGDGDRQGGRVLRGEQIRAEAWSSGVLGEGLGRRQVCLGLLLPFS